MISWMDSIGLSNGKWNTWSWLWSGLIEEWHFAFSLAPMTGITIIGLPLDWIVFLGCIFIVVTVHGYALNRLLDEPVGAEVIEHS